MADRPDVDELMAVVDSEWPNAPLFTAAELAQWRRLADEYADVWSKAVARAAVNRQPDPARRRFRPDFREMEAVCKAVRGPYRKFEPEADRPVASKNAALAALAAARRQLYNKEG